MNWSVETLLTVHVASVTAFLAIAALLLLRRKLFRWNKTGFWAWAAFALYYAINPLFALIDGDLSLYRQNLSISGGIEHGLWILIVTFIGMSAFFIAYLSTRSIKFSWQLRSHKFSLPMIICMIGFIFFGIYSILTQRAMVINTGQEKIIEGGRFVGQVTGYENAGYLFIYVPVLILLLAKSTLLRIMGGAAAVAFIFLILPSGWGRVIPVSMLLAISMIDTFHKKATWPRVIFLPLLLVFTISLQMRGHTTWTVSMVSKELSNLAVNSINNFGDAVGSRDSSMLTTWYIDSYFKDTITGYNYGLPMINYILTGWIPNRILPEKYFLVDWLKNNQSSIPQWASDALYGTKSSLLGSFYGEGGVWGVLLLAALSGLFSRKMDGMLRSDAHPLIKSVGIAWLSILWMVWGSNDTWGFMTMGVMALPAIAIWLVSPKFNRSLPVRPDDLHQEIHSSK